MMKLAISILSVFILLTPVYAENSTSADNSYLVAKTSTKKRKRTSSARKKSSKSKATTNRRRTRASGANLMGKVKQLALSGNYKEASKLLFTLSRSSRYKKDAAQVKYMLGLMLMELKLYQTASFVFYDAIDEELKSGGNRRYLRQSLGKLSYLSHILDSDVLLKYAVSRIQIKDFPAESRDLFFYRFGELKMREGRFTDAARSFAKVDPDSTAYPQALYKQGLAYTEMNQLGKAVAAFEELLNVTRSKAVTDPNRVNALMALARVYYQGKKWNKAIGYYRQIPRDTLQWHDAVFETSWAMFRSGQYFRSALSNFHTLHSPFYDKIYSPESLLLRAIVYLYICRYDEMEKVLELYDRVYKPVQSSINKMLARSAASGVYWDEIKRGLENRSLPDNKKYRLRLDDMVINALLKENLIKSNVNYYKMLNAEENRIRQLGPDWSSASIGKFSKRIIDRRQKSTQNLIGKLSRNYLLKMKSELRDFFEQGDFLKFEMVSGKKEALGKRIVGKDTPNKSIIDENSRSFFIANGYEYWPFQGEYWLDELGNYHYVGVQACQ